jgi:membrane protease YdiL (CAAX protease family)
MPEAVPQRQSISHQPGFWSRVRRLAIIRILAGAVIVVATVAIIQIGAGFAARNPNIKYFFVVTRLPALVVVVAVLFVYRGFVRWFEKRSVSELDSRSALPNLIVGIALGAMVFALTIGVLSSLGVYRVVGVDSWTVLWPNVMAAAVAAVFEEVLFRGIIFRITEESLGSWLALVISALLFGAAHLLDKNANLQAGVAIALEAGVFLAAAYMVTRRLWFVMGVHFGWNFTEGGIFGAAVSGTSSPGLLKANVTGSVYLSGGMFGVEASVVAIAICFLVALAFLWRAKQRGQFVRPFWRRAVVES